MQDITMCENRRCPLKGNCYRFLAIPQEYQSYAIFECLDTEESFEYIPIYAEPDYKNKTYSYVFDNGLTADIRAEEYIDASNIDNETIDFLIEKMEL